MQSIAKLVLSSKVTDNSTTTSRFQINFITLHFRNFKIIFIFVKLIIKTIFIMNKILLIVALVICSLNTHAFKVYIFADMEGCSMLVNREQLTGEEGPLRMAEDINACIEGCFLAGAIEVVVRDGHSKGLNVDPKLIDQRATLIQGPTPGVRFKNLDGSEAVILLGYHGMAQTKNAIMAHSYSSATIQMMYLNGKPVGEIGVDAIIAGEHKIPVVMVSGDDKATKEAKEWIPGVVTCQVKTGTSYQTGKCLPLDKSLALIKKKTTEALSKRNSIKLTTTNYPATMRWEYIPKDYPRVYSDEFKPVANPKTKEKTSENSVEQLLISK